MRNTQKFGQTSRSKKRPRPTLRSGKGSQINCNTSHQIPVWVIEAVNARGASVSAPARFANLQCPPFAPESEHPTYSTAQKIEFQNGTRFGRPITNFSILRHSP